MSAPLWRPSAERVAGAVVTRFIEAVNERYRAGAHDYHTLQRWSCERPEEFWAAVWDESSVVAETRGERVLVDPERIPGARFFPDARLNFAENLLRRRDEGDAIVFRGEEQVERRLSWNELAAAVARFQQELRDAGVCRGDRVAAFLPNLPEAIIGMLATASLGAVWSSCSPDFGVRGVLDRFSQIDPKVLITADGYFYKGRRHDSLERARRIAAGLPGLERVLVVPYLDPDLADPGIPGARIVGPSQVADEDPSFVAVGFNDPLYLLYSSGTTGKPKCIVHGVGGTLLKHLSEHRLMCDVRASDRVFYFTTCGWMMWNWLASALASEATLLLYDGNPFWPDPEALFRFVDAERGTLFGTSAKYIDALGKVGADPGNNLGLEALRTIASTGSPLVPEGFDYVYEHIKGDVCLSSISGGTDIVGCFVGGNPIGPVWRGEIQAPTVGMGVDIFGPDGTSLAAGKGELVCTRPFPSMPIGFWDDPGSRRYRAAYFETFPGVWHHGDYAEKTAHAGVIIHGRSDATLNPGGVRIGTAEIYRVVEAIAGVEEAIVVGQDWDDDVRIVLFVKLRGDRRLDEEMVAAIRNGVRLGCSPRHVPAKVLQVDDIPRTRSGKIVELAVRDVIHGRPVKNKEALANPEALSQFADLAELAP